MWYELRWGLTSCAILTVSLITVIFYYHPSTTNVTSFFRTVTILSEGGGRVVDVFVVNNQRVEAGDPLFKLDDTRQQAAAETARRRIEEVNAALVVTQSELASAEGVVDQARFSYLQTLDELEVKRTLKERGSSAVNEREIQRLENLLGVREGAVDAVRHGRAVHAARRRLCEPDTSPCRRAGAGGRGTRPLPGRLQPDLGAGH